MRKYIIIIGLFILFIAIWLSINQNKIASTYVDNKTKNIVQNISLPFHKTKDNEKFFNANANGYWGNNPSNPKPSDIGGNFEIVYGNLNNGQLDYIKDVMELYNTVKSDLAKSKPDVEMPPLWLYLGIALGESGNTVNIGGINFPSFLTKYTGDSIKDYKKGEIYTEQGINTTGTYNGVFQMTQAALDVGAKYYGIDKFNTKAQFYSLAVFQDNKRKITILNSYKPDIVEKMGNDVTWAASAASHVTSFSLSFNEQYSDIWLPLLNYIYHPSITNTLINNKTYAYNIKEKRSVFTGLALYSFSKYVKENPNMNLAVRIGSDKSQPPKYIPREQGYPASTWYNRSVMTKLYKDFDSYVPKWELSDNNVNLISNELAFKYEPNRNQSYIEHKNYSKNGSSVIAITSKDNKNHYVVVSGAQFMHMTQSYHLGRYLEQAMGTMIQLNGQSNSRNTRSSTTPSIYYSEFQQLQNNETPQVDARVIDYNNLDVEAFKENLPSTPYIDQDVKSYSGKFEEVGYKGNFPIFAQSPKNISGSTLIKFNNNSTTLYEAGCSIYATTSLLHYMGLGDKPIPNDIQNSGINENNFISPSSLSNVLTAPVTPNKVAKLGYNVKQLPTNTPDDIRNIMKEVKNGTPYVVNVRKGNVKALDTDGKVTTQSFTETGHFIIISNVVDINDKTYFEVVDSNYNYNSNNTNRLLFDLEDAIAKDIFKSSVGYPVPAFTILGINDEISTVYDLVENSLVKDSFTLYQEALVVPNKDYVDIYYDNYNKITVKRPSVVKNRAIYSKNTKVTNNTTLSDVLVNDILLVSRIGEVSKGE